MIWDEVVWIAAGAGFYLDGTVVWTENPPGKGSGFGTKLSPNLAGVGYGHG